MYQKNSMKRTTYICKKCGKPLRSFTKTKDWYARCYHKSCWKEIQLKRDLEAYCEYKVSQ